MRVCVCACLTVTVCLDIVEIQIYYMSNESRAHSLVHSLLSLALYCDLIFQRSSYNNFFYSCAALFQTVFKLETLQYFYSLMLLIFYVFFLLFLFLNRIINRTFPVVHDSQPNIRNERRTTTKKRNRKLINGMQFAREKQN